MNTSKNLHIKHEAKSQAHLNNSTLKYKKQIDNLNEALYWLFVFQWYHLKNIGAIKIWVEKATHELLDVIEINR